eukprot:CAMPEP_0183744128 /NCGR_PEP_ID=MMETSP0737-20130205/65570_1 /TAXON_ID=385413 /ORGANISM="Thalassiosira miniscula, Strain CCMP1093" /LENGTH=191 /DNA_ID=CAMNT_0025979763 /DNA_START=272 /DNA_END=843 /DNA_ORIENTATION=+
MQSKEEFPTLLSFNDDVLVGITSYLKPNEMASAAKSLQKIPIAYREDCVSTLSRKEEFPTLLSFNDDVLVGITSYLKPNEMASAAKSCKRFQLLTERTVYQLYQDATPYEKTALPKYHDESWVELYHHLLMLRSPLIFSQLIGSNIRYLNGKSHVGVNSWMEPGSCAICSEQVMRAGKHYAIFKKGNDDRS